MMVNGRMDYGTAWGRWRGQTGRSMLGRWVACGVHLGAPRALTCTPMHPRTTHHTRYTLHYMPCAIHPHLATTHDNSRHLTTTGTMVGGRRARWTARACGGGPTEHAALARSVRVSTPPRHPSGPPNAPAALQTPHHSTTPPTQPITTSYLLSGSMINGFSGLRRRLSA